MESTAAEAIEFDTELASSSSVARLLASEVAQRLARALLQGTR
jgi:hypothetical protein